MGVLQLFCVNIAWADQRSPIYVVREDQSSSAKLACVASGGAWPFLLARRLVGGVLCLVDSVKERDAA